MKNITAFYRQKLDAIFERRPEYVQASLGHCTYVFEVNPEKSFNRGFTDYFIHGRQPNIGSPFTPKSMGEYIGEVRWCNSVQMEIATDKTLHNGDGLCFLNQDNELIGIRADVVHAPVGMGQPWRVSCNRPHGAFRGAKIHRNYDIEWQHQVEASTGNRKIDIDLVLEETETGYKFACRDGACTVSTKMDCEKIPATNPEKALENIRKKALQWGDTIYHPVSLEIRFSQPYLIPASVIGEMRRNLMADLTTCLTEQPKNNRSCCRDVSQNVPTRVAPDAIPTHLMTCHHCIRYASGMCPKATGKSVGPLFIRNGENIFHLDFDCKNCLMYVCTPE